MSSNESEKQLPQKRLENMKSAIKKNVRKKAARLQTQCFMDYSWSYNNTVLLAGSGRSGTTWLSDVINYNREYRYVFEPFHPEKVRACQHFGDQKYIRIDDQNVEDHSLVQRVLSGRVRSYWSDRFNERRLSNKRLIKSIRINLLLKWLHLRFPDVPIVYLMRHPLAVAVSRTRYKHWHAKSLDKYLNQPDLMQDFLEPFRQELETSERTCQITGDFFDNHIFSWCIQNYVPLQQFSDNELHIVFYEDCCVNPEIEIERLFDYLKKKPEKKILEEMKTASRVSRKDSAILTGNSLIDGWKSNLRTEQVDRALEILNLFGLDQVYSEKPMPRPEGLASVTRTPLLC